MKAERIAHRYKLGDTVRIMDMWRAKIVKLEWFESECTGTFIPYYKVKTYLGTTNHLDNNEIKVYEHQMSL